MKKNDRLDLLQELGQIGIWEWYFDTEKSWVSYKVYELFGESNEQESNYLNLVDKYATKKTFKRIKLVNDELKTSDDIYDEIIKIHRADNNELRYLRIRGTLILDDQGKKEKIYGIIRDVTNDIVSQEQILVVNKRFEVAIEESPFPTFLHTEDGEMVLVNKATLAMSGYKFSEINTLEKWITKVHPDREIYNADFVKNMFDSEKVLIQGETEAVITKTGEKRYWEFHNSFLGIMDNNKKGMLTICVDVTEKILHEEAQRRLMKELANTQLFLQASLNSPKNLNILSLDKDYNYLFFNKQHQKTMMEMYACKARIGKNVLDCISNPYDRKRAKACYDRAMNGESYSDIEQYGLKNIGYYETFYNPVYNDKQEIIGVIIFSSNVTERIEELERIKESEEKFRLIYSSMSQSLAVHEIITDENMIPIDYRFIDVNDSYLKLFGYKKEDVIGRTIKEVAPDIDDHWIEVFGEVALTGNPRYYEDYSTPTDKMFSTYAYSPKQNQFAVLISDITDRIQRENEIKYLSYNDQLTGVYNRRFYEEQLIDLDQPENLPLSMIMGDVNGLKLVNDSFGHLTGDILLQKVAKLLQKACRSSDIITRIGGDEFVILLPNTTYKSTEKVINRIAEFTKYEQVESIDISISFGFGTKTEPDESLINIFKNVEDEMYRNKLIESGSMRSKTVDLIIQTLYEKNPREMTHSKRVSKISELIALEYKKDKDFANQVRVGALMHDIGKIGIEESILNSTGKLTDDEWKAVKKHSEIGYRILSSINEFSEIATHILEHHEHWDGSGYPKGLKAEEISMQARIICVADAFDAMTGPRSYKDPISFDEAINEIIRCAGTQFDPDVVDVFTNKVIKKYKKTI